jgi:excisionase family DNA binding protein
VTLTTPAVTEFLTVPEVAAELRVDETTVRRHIRRGDLRATKPFGVVRVARHDLAAYLEQSLIEPDQQRLPTPAVQAPRSRQRAQPPAGSVRDRLRSDRKRAA